ncbi:SGNH/GDSL hydrolase family protein [Actinokineospora globicatena]|uniref:Lipase n=1 Tax=Actinokineospora globicatena TaxID=103729 RepID=A0A9W6QP81_9PSEU|nr:SGNH/GDSL hydrolase family protein [Actinokineospora globicatena]MCP2305346.1 Lysophospholipase L1 [Actinokineospora globicatena]GLW80823.1 lipase [Actinokineospora globicatena]GLW87650.1 lipase [Actinokineospora globicatena]GLW93626.1 lipase [Actinokineospora globicatena]
MNAHTSMVAVGDSFTEGMSDFRPDGTCRGWADLVAARLAEDTPGFRYANLAIRGKLVRQIVDEQVDQAAAMRPDLVTFAGGMNDVLRPTCDMDALAARVRYAIRTLSATSRQVVLFRVIDPTRRMRGSSRLLPRITRLLSLVDTLADEYDAVVVDLFSSRVFDSPGLWAPDRIHLNTEGHRRVAEATLRALGVEPTFDWDAPVPVDPAPWRDRATADLRWARAHAGPWIARRLTGRSSGDGQLPKRPELDPFTP